jgi:hypothetical protein
MGSLQQLPPEKAVIAINKKKYTFTGVKMKHFINHTPKKQNNSYTKRLAFTQRPQRHGPNKS